MPNIVHSRVPHRSGPALAALIVAWAALARPVPVYAAADREPADADAWQPVDWHPFWVSPFRTTLAPEASSDAGLVSTLVFEYQHRSLRAVLASPDPRGRQLELIEHWLVAHLALAWQPVQRLELGFVQRLSLLQRGLGPQALGSRRVRPHTAVIGDAQLWAQLDLLERPAFFWTVLQRVTLPWGAEHSWLHGPFTYAPAMSWDFLIHPQIRVGTLLGARLRPVAQQGAARLGSEAEAQLHWHVQPYAPWELGGALTWLPALTVQEWASSDGAQRLRRVPAEASFEATFHRSQLALQLGSAFSLPLTVERSSAGTARYAGPPGPVWRLWLRAERSW